MVEVSPSTDTALFCDLAGIPRKPEFQKALARARLFTCTIDGQPAGGAMLIPQPYAENELHTCLIGAPGPAILAAFRQLCTLLKAAGIPRITTFVPIAAGNLALRYAARAAGFEPTGQDWDRLTYAKTLCPSP